MKLNVKKNTISGSISGIINKIIATGMPFIMRTIMIHFMGTQYLGLSSLFTSILSMLSLAELGFGSALVYSMYKPIAENDSDTICALMGLYKRIYRIIGTCILLVGLIITLFVNYFISGDVPDDINIYILFLIYLLNTVLSYFLFAYKNCLLYAFQRNDISNNVNSVLTIIEYASMILIIILFRNYYMYVLVFPVITVLGNVIRAVIVDKKYPQYKCKGTIGKDLRRDIYKKTFALACHKIGNTISNSLDSLVVSSFLGLSAVAIFGNYHYIATTLVAIIWIVYYSMTAGIGNRMVLLSRDENYHDFKALTSLNNIICIWAFGCLVFLYQPFIELWTGEQNMLPNISAFLFACYFLVTQSRKIVMLYKDAAGLWKEDQWAPILGAAFNLIVNITLVQIIGINGVVLSTILSYLLVEMPWEIYVLYKRYFGKNVLDYIAMQFKMVCLALPCWLVLGFICSHIQLSAIMTLIIRGIICAALPVPYLIFCFRKDYDLWRLVMKTLPSKFASRFKLINKIIR